MEPHQTLSLLHLIFIFFLSTLSSSSSLSTLSISHTSNQILICALVPSHTHNFLPFLNCSSFPKGTQIPITYRNVSISSITGGDGFHCVLRLLSSSSSINTLNCWRFSDNGTYKRIYKGQMLDELDAGNSHICGLVSRTNHLECWQWPEFNSSISANLSGIAVGGEFVCGLSELGNISCFGNDKGINDKKPDGNFSVVAAGIRHACAISLDRKLKCWGNMVGNEPEGEFKSLALGNNRSCALRTNETIVCWGENDFKLPKHLQETHFITIKAKGNVFCGVLTTNYSLFCWGNEMLDSNSKVFERVLPGPCRLQCPCKIVPGSGNFCNQGVICHPCQITPTCANSPALSPAPTASPPSNGSDTKRVVYIVVGCIGSVLLVMSLCFIFFRYCMGNVCRVHDSGRLDDVAVASQNGLSRPQMHIRSTPASLEKRLSQLTSIGHSIHLSEFSLEELLQATNNFSEDHKIAYGSFGSVYRAILDDGREVAVKRAELTSSSSYGVGTKHNDNKENAFLSELMHLSRLNHRNLVQLLGYCEEANERVLVYEFMTNGSLHDHLHKLENSPLRSWKERLKVALDAARGIEYLHEYAVPQIIHRDIKSSNILLDDALNAKVSDFGLSLLGPENGETHLSLNAAGTVGYMDPEYYKLQQLSTKSDVYSFGIVLLELLSGYKAIHPHENGSPRNVVDFAVPHINADEIHQVLDPKLPVPTPFEIEAVAYVGYLAADCVSLEGQYRPSMTEIVNSLERALATCTTLQEELPRSATGSSIEQY